MREKKHFILILALAAFRLFAQPALPATNQTFAPIANAYSGSWIFYTTNPASGLGFLNGASIPYVATVSNNLVAYMNAATNGFVTSTITNGLATISYVNIGTNFVGTNDLAQLNSASNVLSGQIGTATALTLTIGGNATNYANAIGLGVTNLALRIGANDTNFAYLIGLNATNYANAIGLSATNLTLQIGANGTNFANLIGLNATNYANTVGLNTTNLALRIGANDTNFAYLIGLNTTNYANVIGLGATNLTLQIGANGTNFANLIGLNATNYTKAAIIADTNFPVGLNAHSIYVTNNAIIAGNITATNGSITTTNIVDNGNIQAQSSSGFPIAIWSGTSGNAKVNANKTEYGPPNSSTALATSYASGGTSVPAPKGITLVNLYVIIGTATGGTNAAHTSTFTVLTNGVASPLAVSISGTGTSQAARTFSDITDSINIPAGTEIGVEIQTGTSAANSPYSWSFEGE